MIEPYAIPPRLVRGQTIAVLSLSSGMAAEAPWRYAAGRDRIQSRLGLNVVEAPHAFRTDEWLRNNPAARAADFQWALENPEVAAIFCTIGGVDAIRTLPFVGTAAIEPARKAFLGFSDCTCYHALFAEARVVSFYGPTVMTGFAEVGDVAEYSLAAAERVLFSSLGGLSLTPTPAWTDALVDWHDPGHLSRPRALQQGNGWVWLQGRDSGPVTGRLVGGCLEVLEMLKQTQWWPSRRCWQDAIVHFEISHPAPPPWLLEQWLRNYGMLGILEGARALLLSRFVRCPPDHAAELFHVVSRVVNEFGRASMPIICDLDFGHVAPMGVLPLGAIATVDPFAESIVVTEPASS